MEGEKPSPDEIRLKKEQSMNKETKSIDTVNNESKKVEKNKKRKKKGAKTIYVNVTQAYYPLIQKALTGLGWKITDSDTKANLFWINQNGSTDVASALLPYQFYNHFPGTVAISRKIDLAKNIELVEKMMPKEYSFHPKSFILPSQFIDMKNYMLSIKKVKKRTFIVKPDKGSLGKGIFLVQDPNQCIDYCEQSIAQKYIDPYLIDGLKFDLRIYVLITSIDPMRIYVYKDGMARFCTEEYKDPAPDNLEHVFCHLTNYSLNKKNENFQANTVVEEEEHLEEKGHKRSMESIFDHMKRDGFDVEKIKHEIDEIIRLTIAAAQIKISSQYRIGITSNDGKSRCFEILGFDIMLDGDGKPWLLEVNNKPSMAAESPFDYDLKTNVIQSAMKIINLNPNFKKLIGQRFQELACVKSPAQRTPSLGDFEGETERAKATKWKQLYPVLPGEESAVEQAIDCARKAQGYKPRKQEEKKPLPAIQESQKVKQQTVSKKIIKNQTATNSYAPKKKMVSTVQQKIFKPTFSNTTPQKMHISSHLYQSSLKSPKKFVRKVFTSPDAPLISQMSAFPHEKINDIEERERLQRIRGRENGTKDFNILSSINILMHVGKQPPGSHFPFTEGFTMKANRFSETAKQKRGYYKNLLFDGVIA